jgi:hypothetical protein
MLPILRRLQIALVSQLTQSRPELSKANVMNRALAATARLD